MSHGRSFAHLLRDLSVPDRGFTFLGGNDRTSYSYADVNRITADLATRWAGLGIRSGDRVALLLNDESEFVPAILAALRAGVVAVPYPAPGPGSRRGPYVDGLRRVCATAGAGLCLAGPAVAKILAEADLPIRLATFADLTTAEPGPHAEPDPDDPAFIQFTSGSTGHPKGVVVSHRALVAHSLAMIEAIDLHGDRDRGVSWLPLYHDMGLIGKVFVAVASQTPVWFLSPQRFVRDPTGFLRLLSEVRGTIAYAPNFAYAMLAQRASPEVLDGLDLSAWRVAGCGAEPVRAGTLRAFARAYAPAGFRASQLTPCYGLAEATLAVTTRRPGEGLRTVRVDDLELASTGRPMPGTEVRIVDDEIVVRCGHLASGYHGDPEATAATWRDGWLHTGDTGFLDDGELFVTGRVKDLIIVNGRNYHPHDIEDAVERVDGVRPGGVAAFATDGEHSEAVHVLVEAVRYPAMTDLPDRVAEAVRSRFSLPVHGVTVVRRGAVPKTSSGKVRRRLAAHLYRSGALAAHPSGEDPS
ncbi:fatty acyl-AMP ligase [Actinoplanes sichuanensis]|uniref:Fatty acyl-AMP ligase n=1 Tax=Actinoplanes sichuanensis TaxID=512349 RepID=A0ABW4ARK0_9ACTN|nr:fatty acyl-AMP ligase [Actinoplanes sichuanensis]